MALLLVAATSPLACCASGSWLQTLLECTDDAGLQEFADCFSASEIRGVECAAMDRSETSDEVDEPQPQTQNSLISYWQSRSLHAEEMRRPVTSTGAGPGSSQRPHSHAAASRRLPSLRGTRRPQRAAGEQARTAAGTPPLLPREARGSRALAQQSIHARRQLEAARADRVFWANRLQMLRRELDRAQLQVDHQRAASGKFQVTRVLNETVAAQIAEERRREAQLREAKAETIRAQQAAHKTAMRQAQQQIIQDKLERGRLSKLHQRNHQSIVETTRREEFAEKCRRRERVQQAKVVALLRRVRERAMRDEEVRRAYLLKISHARREEEDDVHETVELVQESSKLVERIRRLRDVERDIAACDTAMHSLGAQLYNE